MENIFVINDGLKIIVGVSIFFVWVVRYSNIIEEFKQFQLPDWLRDMVGIFKLSFAVMIQSDLAQLVLIGSSGIAVLKNNKYNFFKLYLYKGYREFESIPSEKFIDDKCFLKELNYNK